MNEINVRVGELYSANCSTSTAISTDWKRLMINNGKKITDHTTEQTKQPAGVRESFRSECEYVLLSFNRKIIDNLIRFYIAQL